MTEIKTLYLCNGKMPCAYRKDGKKNEYCYIWGMENGDWCKHTSIEEFAKNKPEKRKFESEGQMEWEYE